MKIIEMDKRNAGYVYDLLGRPLSRRIFLSSEFGWSISSAERISGKLMNRLDNDLSSFHNQSIAFEN